MEPTTAEQPEPERDVFREYHHQGRMRRLRSLLTLAAVATVLVIGISVVAGFSAGRSGDAPVAAPLTGLTVQDFQSTLVVAQAAKPTVHVGLTITADGQSMTATGDQSRGATPADSAMSLIVTTPTIPAMEARFVGGMAYLNLGDLSQGKFVAFALDDQSSPLGAGFTRLISGSDPALALAAGDGTVVSVEPAGPAVTLDGVEAVPYTVVLDTTGVADHLGLDPANTPPQLTYQFWVGPDSLPRKMSFDTGTTNVIATFSRWGEPVVIEPPAADQIVPIPVVS